MSVKKAKRKKDYTSMKTVGVKNVDETFKVNMIYISLKFICLLPFMIFFYL